MKELPKLFGFVCLFSLVSTLGFGQQPSENNELTIRIMEAVLLHDLEKEKDVVSTTKHETLVLMRRAENIRLDLIEMANDPDSMLRYAINYGESEVVRLIKKDNRWLTVLQEYNAKEGEISRIKKGDITLAGLDIRLISNGFFRGASRKGNGWGRFYDKFPHSNGVYVVSKPVIQEDKAVLYMSHSRGGLSGVGKVILLEKKERWQVIHFVELWVS